jgi:hypothetical protein
MHLTGAPGNFTVEVIVRDLRNTRAGVPEIVRISTPLVAIDEVDAIEQAATAAGVFLRREADRMAHPSSFPEGFYVDGSSDN